MKSSNFLTLIILVFGLSQLGYCQLEPINSRPNPFISVDNWADLPNGRTWGSTAGVDIDPDGRHLWAIDRCGTNSCAGSNLDPILKIAPDGNVVAAMRHARLLQAEIAAVQASSNLEPMATKIVDKFFVLDDEAKLRSLTRES